MTHTRSHAASSAFFIPDASLPRTMQKLLPAAFVNYLGELVSADRLSEDIEVASRSYSGGPDDKVKFLFQCAKIDCSRSGEDVASMHSIPYRFLRIKARACEIQVCQAKVFHKPGDVADVDMVLRLHHRDGDPMHGGGIKSAEFMLLLSVV